MIRHKIKYKISFFFSSPSWAFSREPNKGKGIGEKRKNTGEVDGEVAWIWHRLQDEKKGKIEI
jgi:hypothetical protein